jgi:uncharacterized membrane protein
MTQAVAHVTIATSSGALWVALVIHFSAGLMGLTSGFLAIMVAKGGRLHRRAGMVFVCSMITLGFFAAGIALYERNFGSVIGGAFTAYLVFTAFTTVRPLTGRYARAVAVALMIAASALALAQFIFGAIALDSPKRMLNGVPAGMILFLATVTLLAAIGDWRLLRAGSIAGTRRIARHLWRMCFGLFIASGSFFLGQMKFLPESLRIMPLLGALGVAPLIVLLYWMWRVRLRKRLQGLILRTAVEAPGSPDA